MSCVTAPPSHSDRSLAGSLRASLPQDKRMSNDQHKEASLLLVKLPLELRRRIYQCVIDSWDFGTSLHIVSVGSLDGPRLAFRPCQQQMARHKDGTQLIRHRDAFTTEDVRGCDFHRPELQSFRNRGWVPLHDVAPENVRGLPFDTIATKGYLDFFLTCRQM